MRPNVWGVAILWLAVVVNGLAVVSVTYRTRVATSELEILRHEAADLHVQAGQFLLERSTLAAYARIENIALKDLGMTVPESETVMVIKP